MADDPHDKVPADSGTLTGPILAASLALSGCSFSFGLNNVEFSCEAGGPCDEASEAGTQFA